MANVTMKIQYGFPEKIWEPRISWLKPPKIWLFKWAYKIVDHPNRNKRYYSEDMLKKAIQDFDITHPANTAVHIDGEG